MVRVYIALIEKKLPSRELNEYLSILPEEIQQRSLKFHRWQDMQLCLFGKLLLLKGLKEIGIEGDSIRNMKYTRHKRPFIDNAIDFNISHSGELVVCAISKEVRVGIDTEKVQPLPLSDFSGIWRQEELEKINRANDKYVEFYRYWTQKEAVAKAEGSGLGLPFRDIVIEGDIATTTEGRWYLEELSVWPGYMMHLATNEKSKHTIVKQVDIDSLIISPP